MHPCLVSLVLNNVPPARRCTEGAHVGHRTNIAEYSGQVVLAMSKQPLARSDHLRFHKTTTRLINPKTPNISSGQEVRVYECLKLTEYDTLNCGFYPAAKIYLYQNKTLKNPY